MVASGTGRGDVVRTRVTVGRTHRGHRRRHRRPGHGRRIPPDGVRALSIGVGGATGRRGLRLLRFGTASARTALGRAARVLCAEDIVESRRPWRAGNASTAVRRIRSANPGHGVSQAGTGPAGPGPGARGRSGRSRRRARTRHRAGAIDVEAYQPPSGAKTPTSSTSPSGTLSRTPCTLPPLWPCDGPPCYPRSCGSDRPDVAAIRRAAHGRRAGTHQKSGTVDPAATCARAIPLKSQV